MLTAPSSKDVFNAFRVLFGPSAPPLIDLKDFDLSRLKTAYRKKALETHPDRASVVGKSVDEMNRNFMEVTLAYEILNPVIQGDVRIVVDDNTGTQGRNKPYDHFFKGYFPKRGLLIGQFLYYSGLISWKTLIRAITWQRRQRPPVGQIAREWGFLSSREIQTILVKQSYREKFGEYALRKGYITPFQHMAILGKQRGLQYPIGEYFIQSGILSPEEIDIMIERLRAHNIRAL